MSVSDGQPVSAAITNAAYLSRISNSDTIGIIDLLASGNTNIINIQRAINDILDSMGASHQAGTDSNSNQYTDNNHILDGDSYKDAIDKLDIALNVDDIRSKVLNFSSDALYESIYTASAGSIYYNTTDNELRFYDVGTTTWKPIGTAQAMSREVPTGLVNGSNTSFQLGFVPVSEDHFSFFVDGNMVQDDEMSIAGNTVTLNTAPALGQSVFAWFMHDGNVSPITLPSGVEQLIYHEVKSGEEASKSFTLPAAPAVPANTLVDVIGGSSQEFGVDFTISGSTFSWSGLGLDGILLENDKVRLKYLS